MKLLSFLSVPVGVAWASRIAHHGHHAKHTSYARHSHSSSSTTLVEPSSVPTALSLAPTADTSPESQQVSSTVSPTTLVYLSVNSTATAPASSSTASGSANTTAAIPTSTSTSLYAPATFTHPGLLNTKEDFARIQAHLAAGDQPWSLAWDTFCESEYASPTYEADPAPTIYRGSDGVHAENYGQLYRDVAAAYALAVRYCISGNTTFGDAAVRIMDAWSSTLVALGGDTDVYLAAGIYGYEFAQAGELMRDYAGWPADNFTRFQNMMVDVFYSVVDFWFEQHAGWGSDANIVYSNWDLSLEASAMSIGVLTDNQTIYNQGIGWFYNGTGNGQVDEAIPYTHFYDNQHLGQTQESGRDQGHNTLVISLLGVLGQVSYNQGNDLYAYNNSAILAAAEYTARYNLGYDVPYTPYDHWPISLPTISNSSRGDLRPSWEILYNHYGVLKGQNVTWTEKFRDAVRADNNGTEGGSGDYGPNSGGYDQLGWGTLLYTLEASE